MCAHPQLNVTVMGADAEGVALQVALVADGRVRVVRQAVVVGKDGRGTATFDIGSHALVAAAKLVRGIK